MYPRSRFAAAAFLSLVAFTASASGTEPLRPMRTHTPPRIDGLLDDAVWQQAPHVTGFKTFIPDFGHEMIDQTVVYTAYDHENLYFAFRCFDSQPDKIKSSITRRDNIRADDWVCINLDSFNDQQGLYAFYVNPAGIQGDTRYAAGREDDGVDLVWYSAGHIDGQGYSVEVQLPFKSIRFANRKTVEMGVIFERRVSRRSEQGTFPPLKPERGFAFLTQMHPVELTGIKYYRLFELLPAVTGSQNHRLENGALRSQGMDGELSLTTKYGLTSELIVDGTYNPDFSQVEADAGQVDINLRAALFFDEKRPFFLEGRENFNFAGASSSDFLWAVVHTRQIVNPVAGIKLSGKLSRRSTLASIFAADDLGSGAADRYAYFSIMRFKQALRGDNYAGGFYTGRETRSGYNRVAGADGQFRLDQASTFEVHAMGSNSSAKAAGEGGSGHALGMVYQRSTRNATIVATATDISKKFNTSTGFLFRNGVTSISFTYSPKFYPPAPLIRRIAPRISTTQTRDRFAGLWETNNTVSLQFLSWRNSTLSGFYTYSTEIFLGEKFKTSNWRFLVSSQILKELFFVVNYRNGQLIRFAASPFQGHGTTASAEIIFQPSEKINLNLRATYSDLFRESTGEKIFDVTILRSRTTFQLNRFLFLRAIVEHNTFRRTLLTDFLASFTYIPGTVIHFGYGSLYEKISFENGEYVPGHDYLEANRGLFFKASYLWRM